MDKIILTELLTVLLGIRANLIKTLNGFFEQMKQKGEEDDADFGKRIKENIDNTLDQIITIEKNVDNAIQKMSNFLTDLDNKSLVDLLNQEYSKQRLQNSLSAAEILRADSKIKRPQKNIN